MKWLKKCARDSYPTSRSQTIPPSPAVCHPFSNTAWFWLWKLLLIPFSCLSYVKINLVRILIQNSDVFIQFLYPWWKQTKPGGWVVPAGLSSGKSHFHSQVVTILHRRNVTHFQPWKSNMVADAGLKKMLLCTVWENINWMDNLEPPCCVFVGGEQTWNGGSDKNRTEKSWQGKLDSTDNRDR